MKSLPKVRLPRPRQMSAAEERLVQLNESTLNENFDRLAIELNNIGTSGGSGGGGTETQSDWNEADPASPAYIQNKPTSMAPTAHASTHAANGSDPITPASIGAMAANAVPSAMGLTLVTDLNDAYTEDNNALSFYAFSDSATNGPGYAGFCIYFSYSYPRAVQYAFAVSSARISRRGRATNGTWGSWTHIT